MMSRSTELCVGGRRAQLSSTRRRRAREHRLGKTALSHALVFGLVQGILLLSAVESLGRGFGGMHAGGMRGGIGGAGMRGGGMPHLGGGMPRMGGGMPSIGRGGPGVGRGGPGLGGNLGGGGGLNRGRGGVGNPGGPNFGANRLGSTRGGVGGNSGRMPAFNPPYARKGFPGGLQHGFNSGRKAPNFGGGLGAGGAPGRDAAGRGPAADKPGWAPSRDKLGSFLGLPGEGGLHSLAGHRSPTPHPGASRPEQRLAGHRPGLDQRGNWRRPAPELRRQGDLVRSRFRGRGFYNRGWYGRYPGAWYPGRWAYGSVWSAWSWSYLNGWFGDDDVDPVYYDYGNNVTYQDNSVYVEGENVGTADEYYQQAVDLATTDDDTTAASASTGDNGAGDDDAQWLPLGVFAMTDDDHSKANLILQLAVNKAGTIRGNYTATLADHNLPVQGSVDKKSQRAAWTIGKNKKNVFETGIYNLTKDEAPMLVHLGKEKTEQWTLVRLKDDDDTAAVDAKDDPQGGSGDARNDR